MHSMHTHAYTGEALRSHHTYYMAKHYVAPPYAYTNVHIMPFNVMLYMVTIYVYLAYCITL